MSSPSPARVPFARLPYQRELAAALARALRRGRLAHAYLLEGPRGVGKEAVAYALGAAALCPEAPGEGCGVCNTCRRVFADLHPDFARYESESMHFDIDLVREIVAETGRPPSEAALKFALVVEPEKMTYRSDAPANAFLKTLEEPPGRTIFLLVSHDPRLLLPTIVSRCVNIRFPRLTAAEVATVLKHDYNLEAERAAAVARRANGSIVEAAAVLSEDYAARGEEALTALAALAAGGVPEAFAAAAAAGGREEALALLEIIAALLRDIAALRVGAPGDLLFPEHTARLQVLAAAPGLRDPEQVWEALARAARALHNNANVSLTLGEFFLKARA